jgi:hypothetical protein
MIGFPGNREFRQSSTDPPFGALDGIPIWIWPDSRHEPFVAADA